MKTQQSQTNIPQQSINMSLGTTMSSNTKMTSEKYSLLNENVPITTKQQLYKNLMHWRQLLNAVAEKKLTKITTNYPLNLCYHQDELTCRRIIVNVAEILIKIMSCLDQEKKTSIPQTPQPSSSKREENKKTEKANPPTYRPKNRKRKGKKHPK